DPPSGGGAARGDSPRPSCALIGDQPDSRTRRRCPLSRATMPPEDVLAGVDVGGEQLRDVAETRHCLRRLGELLGGAERSDEGAGAFVAGREQLLETAGRL